MRPCDFISSGSQARAKKDMIRAGDGYTLGSRTREGGPTREDLGPPGSPGGRGHRGDRESQRRWEHHAGRELITPTKQGCQNVQDTGSPDSAARMD